MAYDLFLSIPNIPGESLAKGFTNQIQVYSYSLGFSNSVTFGSSGGQPGKAEFSGLSIMKAYDKSSPVLFKELVNGINIAARANSASMVLSLVPSSVGVATLTYTFQDVFVTSIQDSGSTGGDNAPMQSVSFGYGVIRESYRQQNPDGTLGNPITISYNRETNQSA